VCVNDRGAGGQVRPATLRIRSPHGFQLFPFPPMKRFFVCLLLTSTAFALSPGDTYEKVLAEKGKPKSQAEVGKNRILNYPDVTIQLRDNIVTTIKWQKEPPPARAEPTPPPPATPSPEPAPGVNVPPPAKGDYSQPQIDRIERERLSTINRIKAIVNQKVRSYTKTNSMQVGSYPYWFHEGALVPKFDTVDVRATQEASYDKYDYVTSDLNPGIVWRGKDLEFNSMTKFFYEDRSVPKKKLTSSEMEEINRLYRIVARCDAELKAAHAGDP